jgi:Holliday junction resolvasome RuvABC endonuclease subunit
MNEQVSMFRYSCPYRVMGLDLSLTGTGAVVLDAGEGEIVRAQTIGYDLEKKATEQQKLDRLVNLAAGIKTLIEETHPYIIVIEGHAFGAKFGVARLAELHGVVKVQIYYLTGKAPMVVAPATARKMVLDYGASDKKRIEKIVKKLEEQGLIKIGALGDHNQRDAWVLAQCGRRVHGSRY